MPSPMNRLRRAVEEIHRRSVWQILGIYAVGSWGVLEFVETLTSGLGLPDWFPAFALVLLLVGLPIVLATAFVQEGRSDPGGPDASPAPVAEPGAPTSEGRPRRGISGLFTWRNAALGGLSALALWGVVATAWLVFGSPDPRPLVGRFPASADLSGRRVAVMPFQFRGGGDYAYLGEGMMNLLSTKLDGAADLRAVDPRALLNALDRGTRALDAGMAWRAARELGAGMFVLGDIVEAGGQLRIHAALYGGDSDDAIADAAAEGSADDVFSLVDDIAATLIATGSEQEPTRTTRIAAITTNSVPALKAYLEGEDAFRGGRYRAAAEAYERAIAQDSQFALAHYRLSLAAEWLTWEELAVDAAERAYTNAGRLPERDRELLKGLRAWREGDQQQALGTYRSLLATWPEDIEARFQLGEALFHGNPPRGRPQGESQRAFEQVLRYEPAHSGAINHLIRLAATDRRLDDLDSLVARFKELNPEGDRQLEVLALQAFAEGDGRQQKFVLEALEGAQDIQVALTAFFLATHVGPASALPVLRILTGPDRSARVRTTGHIYAAHALLGLGRRREAARELEEAARLDPQLAVEMQMHLALFPAQRADAGHIAALRGSLIEGESPGSQREGETGFFNPHEGLREAVHAYLLGLSAASLGDSAEAVAWLDEIRAAPVPEGAGSLIEDFASAVAAEVQLESGRQAEALRSLRSVRGATWYQLGVSSPYVGHVREIYLRAELLLATGEDGEALRWLQNTQLGFWWLPYEPLAHLRAGQIYEGRSEMGAAISNYTRALELLGDADPEYEAWRAETREGLRRLGASLD